LFDYAVFDIRVVFVVDHHLPPGGGASRGSFGRCCRHCDRIFVDHTLLGLVGRYRRCDPHPNNIRPMFTRVNTLSLIHLEGARRREGVPKDLRLSAVTPEPSPCTFHFICAQNPRD